jgi:hypothetical protein
MRRFAPAGNRVVTTSIMSAIFKERAGVVGEKLSGLSAEFRVGVAAAIIQTGADADTRRQNLNARRNAGSSPERRRSHR